VLRQVDRPSCVRCAPARFSAPTRLIGTSVTAVLDHGAVCLVESATAMTLAEHELAPSARRRSSTGLDPQRTAAPRPGRGPGSSSARWGLMPKCSHRRGGDRQHPAWALSWRSCSVWVSPTAPTHGPRSEARLADA